MKGFFVVLVAGAMVTLGASAAQASTVWLFGTCGASGASGPSQAQCDATYGAGVVTVAGGIQDWTAATGGTYRVTAIGAQAGHGFQPGGWVGGRGAEIQGDFVFGAGTLLQLAVGQMGASSSANGGGGGGSFIVDAANNPLLVAGGGGGIRQLAGQDGTDASDTEYGYHGSCSSSTYVPTLDLSHLGGGGTAPCASWGSGGGGFNSDGQADAGFGITFGDGGNSWFNGLIGGNLSYCDPASGGFGGGGSGNGCAGGGGGGGYSGGNGGYVAGGGGSFNSGVNPFAAAGVGYGHGSIEIELLSAEVPEPASLLLLGTGIAAFVRRRRRGVSI